MKDFLTVPACLDINFKPPTCCECGGLLEKDNQRYRCIKCQLAWLERLRSQMEFDVKAANDYIHGNKALQLAKPDTGYRYITIGASLLLAIGYMYLVWSLLK